MKVDIDEVAAGISWVAIIVGAFITFLVVAGIVSLFIPYHSYYTFETRECGLERGGPSIEYENFEQYVADAGLEHYIVDDSAVRAEICEYDSDYAISINVYSKTAKNLIVKNAKICNENGIVLIDKSNQNMLIGLSQTREGLYFGDDVIKFVLPKHLFRDEMTLLLELEVQSQDTNGNLGEITKLTYTIDAEKHKYSSMDAMMSV